MLRIFLFFTIETTNFQMDLVVRFDRLGHLLTKSTLRANSQIDLVMILVTIENMLKVNVLIWNVKSYCYDRDEVMQL